MGYGLPGYGLPSLRPDLTAEDEAKLNIYSDD